MLPTSSQTSPLVPEIKINDIKLHYKKKFRIGGQIGQEIAGELGPARRQRKKTRVRTGKSRIEWIGHKSEIHQ